MRFQSQAFARLHQETMAALRAEHPDWTDEVFDDYEARFAELIRQLLGRPRHRRSAFAVQRL